MTKRDRGERGEGGAEVNWSYGIDGRKFNEVISVAW